jgi:hypothetical protein
MTDTEHPRRILLITHDYPPAIAPRAFRWEAIVNEWASAGIQVDVLCAAVPGAADAEATPGVNVYRVRPRFDQENVKSSPSLGNYPQRLFEKARGLLRKAFYWPDYRMGWIPPAVRQGRAILEESRPEAIITVSWPVSSHVAGMLIRRGAMRSIPWIADIGDPFSFNTTTPSNNYLLYMGLNFLFEGRLFRRVAGAAVSTERTRNLYCRYFPGARDKFVVIPPMIPSAGAKQGGAAGRFFAAGDKIRLVFAGSLRKANRPPEALLALFAALLGTDLGERLELHFFGDTSRGEKAFQAYRPLLGTKIFTHGVVPKEVVDRAVAEADVLVNLGNRTDYQLPSKVFEYTASNKPILNVALIGNDSSWEFLSKTPLAINVLAGKNGEVNKDSIRQVIEFIRKPPAGLQKSALEGLIAPYLPEKISQQYLELIEASSGDSAKGPG